MEYVALYQVYNYTDDCVVGFFDDYDDAEVRMNEYVSNYGEPVEVVVEPLWSSHPDDDAAFV